MKYAFLVLSFLSFQTSAWAVEKEHFAVSVTLLDNLIEGSCDDLREEDNRWNENEDGECLFESTLIFQVGKSKNFTVGNYNVSLDENGNFELGYSYGDSDFTASTSFQIPKNNDGVYFVPKAGYLVKLDAADNSTYQVKAEAKILKVIKPKPTK